jgi:O-antigen/teichoic acid export membrane protein
MSRVSRLTHAILSDYVLWTVMVLNGIVLAPFLLDRLHAEGYGLWAIYGSLLGYMGLVDLGLSPTTATQVAQLQARGRQDEMAEWVSNVLLLDLVLMVLVLGASVGTAPFVATLFHVSSALRPTATWAFLAACAGLAMALPRGILRGVIVGHQRTDLANFVDAGFGAAAAVGIIVSLVLGGGLLGATLVGAGISILQTLCTAGVVRRLFPAVPLVPRLTRPDIIAQVLRFSLPILAVYLTAQVVFRTDNIVIGVFRGVGDVATYAVAYAMVWFSLNLVFKLSDSLLPVFSSMQAAGERGALRRGYLESAQVSLALAMYLTVVLTFFGRTAIALWVGPQNFVGRDTLMVLALLPTVHAVTHVGSILLIGLGRAKAIARVSVPDAVLNLVLSVLLVRWLGVVGVALGTIVGELVTSFWYIPVLCNRELHLAGRVFLARVWIRPLLGLPGAALAAWTTQTLLGGGPRVGILLAGGVTTAVAYFSVYFLLSTQSERAMYRAALRGLWAKTQVTAVLG